MFIERRENKIVDEFEHMTDATAGARSRRDIDDALTDLAHEKEAEAAHSLPPDVHSYALLPIG